MSLIIRLRRKLTVVVGSCCTGLLDRPAHIPPPIPSPVRPTSQRKILITGYRAAVTHSGRSHHVAPAVAHCLYKQELQPPQRHRLHPSSQFHQCPLGTDLHLFSNCSRIVMIQQSSVDVSGSSRLIVRVQRLRYQIWCSCWCCTATLCPQQLPALWLWRELRY